MARRLNQASGLQDSDRHSHRRRWLLVAVLAAAVIVVAGAAGVAAILMREDDPFASPETVDLPPPPDDAAPVRLYLAGIEGQRLTRFVEIVDQVLADEVQVDDCEAVVAALDEIGTPDEVFAAAAGVPDPNTSEIAVNHVAASSRFLGRCLEDESVPDHDELQFTAVVFERRLEEVR